MTGVTRPFMKTYSDSIRNGLILMIACLFLGGYDSSLAIGANPQPRLTTVAGPGFVQPGNDAARLVVWRIADLGNFVYVDLSVDGVPVAAIGYGSTYEGFLPPGPACFISAANSQSEMADPVSNDSECAKRSDLQIYRGWRWFRTFDSEGARRTRTCPYPVVTKAGPANALTSPLPPPIARKCLSKSWRHPVDSPTEHNRSPSLAVPLQTD